MFNKSKIMRGFLIGAFSVLIITSCGSGQITPDAFDPGDYEDNYSFKTTPFDSTEAIHIDDELTIITNLSLEDYEYAIDTADFLMNGYLDPRDGESPSGFRKLVELPEEGLIHVSMVLGNGKITFYANGEKDIEEDFDFEYTAGSSNITINGNEMSLDELYDFFYLEDEQVLGFAMNDDQAFKLYNCINARAAVVAKYDFETMYIDSIKDSRGSNDGDLHGEIDIIQQKINKVAYFDGKNDYITVPHSDSLSFGEEFTISMWLNPKIGKKGEVAILAKGSDENNNYKLSMKSGDVSFEYYDSARSQTITISPDNMTLEHNEWYFIAVRVNGEGVSFFLDGENVYTEARTINLKQNNEDMVIGKANSKDKKGYNGMIDDLRLFNKALSDNEIYAVYLSYFCCLE